MPAENKPQKQLCTIKILFPVDSDDTAFCVKKMLGEALKDIPEHHFTFNLMPLNSALQAEQSKYAALNNPQQKPEDKIS